jgi:hypothetical protein
MPPLSDITSAGKQALGEVVETIGGMGLARFGHSWGVFLCVCVGGGGSHSQWPDISTLVAPHVSTAACKRVIETHTQHCP